MGGPWADFPCRIQDLDAKVPEEYLTNATIRDKLPNIKLNKLQGSKVILNIKSTKLSRRCPILSFL